MFEVEDGTEIKVEDALKILKKAKKELDDSRPTAVNLSWATSRMLEFAQGYLTSTSTVDLVEIRKVSLLLLQSLRIFSLRSYYFYSGYFMKHMN